MFDVKAARKSEHSAATTPEPPLWPAVLIVCGVLASILWAAYLIWWLLNALAAMT